MEHLTIPTFKQIINKVSDELADIYGLKVKVFFDGDFRAAKAAVQSPNLIVLCIRNIPDMVSGIHTVCHEYCHLLREASVDPHIQDIQRFYLHQCREYYGHEETARGRLVYKFSLLELDAEAFARSWGTVCTDRYFSLLSVDQLVAAYEESPETLVALIRQTFEL